MKPGSQWVRALRLSRHSSVIPVCSTDTITRVTEVLGEGPVAWAVEQASEIAGENIFAFSHLGGGSAQLDTLRLGVESATFTVLECLYGGRMVDSELSPEAGAQVRDFVHRRIALSDIWAIMRQGHASLIERLMKACVRLADPAERSEQLVMMTRITFEYTDHLAAAITRMYAKEQQRLEESAVVSKEAALRSLLSDDEEDVDSLSSRLQYDVGFRWHRAFVFSRENPGKWDDLLTHAAREAMKTLGVRQTLMVPQGHAVLWVIGNSPSTIDELTWLPPTSVKVAVGESGWGPAGLRTSHRQAMDVHRMIQYVPDKAPISTYRDVNLARLLLADMELAQEFVHYELGNLASRDAGTEELRRTLLTYLGSHNAKATADALFVARNTVTYRLRKAETLLAHSISERQLQTQIALYLAQLNSFHPSS